MARHTARLTSKGQITIPKPVRERLGLDKGDLLLFEGEGERVVMRRASLAPAPDLARLTERIAAGLEAWGLPRSEVDQALSWARGESGTAAAAVAAPPSPAAVAATAAAEPEPEPELEDPPPLRELTGGELEKVLRELRQRLTTIYGSQLTRLVLFGSHARGEAGPDSDVNVLVVLAGAVDAGEEIRRTSRAVAQLSLEHGVVISRAFVAESRFRRERSPLLLAVRREGVAL